MDKAKKTCDRYPECTGVFHGRAMFVEFYSLCQGTKTRNVGPGLRTYWKHKRSHRSHKRSHKRNHLRAPHH